MWNDTRRGFNLIRGRKSNRKRGILGNIKNLLDNLQLNKNTIMIFSGIAIFLISVIFAIVKFSGSNVIQIGFNDVVETSADASIYSEVASNQNESNNTDNTNSTENDIGAKDTAPDNGYVNTEDGEKKIVSIETATREFSFIALGEIMMGNYQNGTAPNYASAFIDIADETKNADYTFTTTATNIIDVEKIENPSSQYIVTKDIVKAYNALGIDGVNVASEHMMDFTSKIFEGTKSIINEANMDIIGLQNDIIYAKKDGIEVAFIGICNEAIGSYSKYNSAGIWMYDNYMSKIKEGIDIAKKNADAVVVITHLGSENAYEVTEVMEWFYHELINAGADMVLGNHALGVYPIEIYNDKPIIYSLGYLYNDTTYEVGKKSGIFKFSVNVDGTITKLEFTPTYITNNKVVNYSDYDSIAAKIFMQSIAKYNIKYGFNSNIVDGKLIIEF